MPRWPATYIFGEVLIGFCVLIEPGSVIFECGMRVLNDSGTLPPCRITIGKRGAESSS
jgi:hypothetical protein